MNEVCIHLIPKSDGACRVCVTNGAGRWDCVAAAEDVAGARQAVQRLMKKFEHGNRPIADPVEVAEVGVLLRDVFLSHLDGALSAEHGALLFVSEAPEYLNLPWELLPRPDCAYLIEDPRWSIRRTTRETLPESAAPLVARPLRVLFMACAPTNLDSLGFEKEEEAFLRIANRLGGKVHLDVAESGTFDELRRLIPEYKPHVVHLSGHGAVQDGTGYFCFEDERGKCDARGAREIADQLFAGNNVRLVFVSGCETAQAGAAGLCQSLTATDHVPLALGWGESIGDGFATEFAHDFYHGLAAGQSVDHAVSAARRALYEQCRVKSNNIEFLDISFALPQLYAAETLHTIIDEHRTPERVERPGIRYELLADNIRGLREGFVGRRRILQKTRPALRSGEKHVLLLTGIGGAGKSTLATRLANRFKLDGYRIAAVRAQHDESGPSFCLRLLTEIATACQRLGRENDERVLLDGQRPIANRLRLAVEVLNDARILLVLDNLEAAMPAPPAPPQWSDPDFAGFMRDLTARLVGEGRAILTCRYVPEGFDANAPNLANEPLPDFTEADFFKYLLRNEEVATRIEHGELPGELLTEFNKKLGGTPRFIEQACAILARIDPDDLREQLERVEAPESGTGPDELYELQQNYFRDLFLPQLYDALPAHGRLGLSRLAVTEIPLLLVGVALVANIGESEVQDSVNRWLRLGLVQRFGEDDEVPVFAIYPLQRTFLIEPARLGGAAAQDAHRATATFLRECFEKGRQSELRLPLVAGLLACLHHATEARDPECRRWATVELAWRLIGCAEYVVAEALVKPVMQDDRHPDLLNILARVRLGTSDWKSARELYQEVLIGREACRDRSGEGSVWHNLATIDSNERVYDKAREKFAKSLSIRQALGDRVGEASTRNSLAAIDVEEGKYEKAREKLGEVLAMYQALGNRAGEGSVRHNLATIDLYEGKYEGARENYGRALEAKHAVGDRAGEASVWHGLASVDVSEGNYKDAREELGKALEIFRAIRDRAAEASTWHQLGLIDLHEGKSEQARQNFGKSLSIGQAIGDPAREASAWHGLGSVALNEKKYDEAREKYKKSLSISQSIGDRACEAASFYQIGVMAWELAQREVGIRLIALGLAIQTAIGAGEVQVKLTGLVSMAQDMGLDPAGFEELTKEVVKGYRGDRGAALLKTAFEGL